MVGLCLFLWSFDLIIVVFFIFYYFGFCGRIIIMGYFLLYLGLNLDFFVEVFKLNFKIDI